MRPMQCNVTSSLPPIIAAGIVIRNSTALSKGGSSSAVKQIPFAETSSVTALYSRSPVVKTISRCRGKRTEARIGSVAGSFGVSGKLLLHQPLKYLSWLDRPTILPDGPSDDMAKLGDRAKIKHLLRKISSACPNSTPNLFRPLNPGPCALNPESYKYACAILCHHDQSCPALSPQTSSRTGICLARRIAASRSLSFQHGSWTPVAST